MRSNRGVSTGGRSAVGFTLAGLVGGFIATMAACGSDGASTFVETPDAAPEASITLSPAFPDASNVCEGYRCQQVDCGSGAKTTTVIGKVTAPNGTLPLYNVIVYVPTEPLEAIKEGVQCDRCGSVSGKPLVSTLTKVDGTFELPNMPVGEDIPLVVQVGKWRRQLTIPAVRRCETTAIEPTLTRLPKNRAEGDMPRVAVTTGQCDVLACLLPKLGLDPSTFDVDNNDTRRVDLFRGDTYRGYMAPAPDGTPTAQAGLYSSVANFSKYDVVMLSCECGEHNPTAAGDAERAALYAYMSAGGRVFASHFHYTWATKTGPLNDAANWIASPANPENPPGPYLVDTSFPKGDAFSKWLVAVNASTKPGEMPINQARQNVGTVKAGAQRWVYSENAGNPRSATKYLSINAPVSRPADQQCGKFVFADLHLYAGDEQFEVDGPDLPDNNFPTSCATDLTPEEKALAFLFFDLSSCIQDEALPPVPPVK